VLYEAETWLLADYRWLEGRVAIMNMTRLGWA